MKTLFIPLKTAYFNAFKDGSKRIEYRPNGPRWNERTCPIGRLVVLSRGYGKKDRLNGQIVGFAVSDVATQMQSWKDCYGDRKCQAACITIEVIK